MLPKPHRILIVDDDLDSLANLSDILADVGYETETAPSGAIALEKIYGNQNDHAPFDLCLLDFKLPGMDGVELLKQIHIRMPNIPVIMITAYAGDNGIQRALAAGTRQVLRKPVDVAALMELIVDSVAKN